MVHSQSTSFAERHGFLQLGLAWLFVGVINTAVFIICNLYIEKNSMALMVMVIFISIITIIVFWRAWQEDSSMFWQYATSQFALSMFVICVVAGYCLDANFYRGSIIYGLGAAALIALNVTDKDLRSVQKWYITIHLITAATAFTVAYLKYT